VALLDFLSHIARIIRKFLKFYFVICFKVSQVVFVALLLGICKFLHILVLIFI
jgi:hypothetical protein